MVLPLAAHDALLHQVEQPLTHELQTAKQGADHDAGVAEHGHAEFIRMTVDETACSTRKSSEKTPLLMTGKRLAADDSDADLKALAVRLTKEERQALLEDERTPLVEFLKQEARGMVVMSMPLIFVVLVEQLPNVAMMAMLGQIDPVHSTEILAACGIAGIFQTVVLSGIVSGLGGALDTVCAQAYGAKRYAEFWLYIQAGLMMLAACLPILAVVFLNGAPIARALGQNSTIAEMASPLLVICFLSLPLLMIVMVQKSALQGQGITKPLAACSVLSWVVTLPVAYALGFYTPLGYVGIYLSSIINYAVQLLVLHPFITGNDVFRESWPGWNLSKALRLLRKLVPLGISNLLMTTFQMLGLIVVALLVGTLPDPAVATAVNGIFTSCASLSWTPMIGICIAGSIRMGNALGACQARRASIISHVLLGLTCLFGILGMIVIVTFADPITRLFTVDEEIIHTTVQLFHSCAFGIPIVGSVFSFQAIFRACGEQWFCAKLLGFFVVVVGAPLGVLLATQFGHGIAGLWYGNCIGTLGMIAGTLLWLYYLDWEEMTHNARLNTHLNVEEPDVTEAV